VVSSGEERESVRPMLKWGKEHNPQLRGNKTMEVIMGKRKRERGERELMTQ